MADERKPNPDVIEVKDMGDAQRQGVINEVLTSILFVEDDPPPTDVAHEIAASLMERDARFASYPRSNGRGGQSAYIQGLHEAIMAELKRPVQQEEGVREAYVDPSNRLGEVEQIDWVEHGDVVADEAQHADDEEEV